MKKHICDPLKLEVEELEYPPLLGSENPSDNVKVTKSTLTKGTARFTRTEFHADETKSNKKQLARDSTNVALEWQSFSELGTDHGFSLSYEILHSEGFGIYGKHTSESMSADIAKKVGDSSWKRIEKHLLRLDEESGHREVFLQAGWAQLFAEPFEELWLAAMAQHAHYVLEDDFAFGYLTAQIDQKRDIEAHFLRGKKSIESASLGGLVRSSEQHKKTQQTLTEMKRLIEDGQSVARSASLAHKSGFGTSEAANKKLWTRHSKK